MRNFLVVLLSVILSTAVVAAAFFMGGFNENKIQTKTITAQPSQPANPTKEISNYKTPNQIYKENQSGVLYISTKGTQKTNSLLGPSTEETAGQGSGFLIDNDGNVVTNAHVVAGATQVSVVYKNKSTSAKVVGTDTSTDLSLLKIDPKAFDLTPLSLGNSKKLEVGDAVLAIGNPLGYDHTLTTGVVSALGRTIPSPNGFQIPDAIQTDASINPGNSGGPLFDDNGKVIGITSQIATNGESSSNIGIGFAIPIDIVKKLIPKLKEGNIKRPYIGIQGASTKDLTQEGAKNLPSKGVVVISVTKGGPAELSGIKATQSNTIVGDVLLKYNNKELNSMEQLVEMVESSKVGEKVNLLVLRNNKEQNIELVLKQRPDTEVSQGQ